MVRRVTTVLIIFAVVLTLTWPFTFGHDRPNRRDPIAVRRSYASKLLLHTTGIIICLVGAGVGAALISRQARQEYRQAAMRNLRTLVEGEDPEAP